LDQVKETMRDARTLLGALSLSINNLPRTKIEGAGADAQSAGGGFASQPTEAEEESVSDDASRTANAGALSQKDT